MAHRIRSFQLGDIEPIADDTTISGQYFDAHGNIDTNATLCIASTNECAQRAHNPYIHESKSQLLSLSPCQIRDALENKKALIQAVVTQGARETKVAIPLPTELGAAFTIRRDMEGYWATVTTKRPVTQVLAWAEERQGRRVIWTSEDPASQAKIRERHIIDIRIPKNVGICQDCRVVIQVASIDDGPSLGLYSEDRASFDAQQLNL